ncbi:ATP-binding protein [Lysinibacillus sp. NPDC056232]|uniref:sensor histidine kinase n=1 Tax=Lysinibacillus sp. NPDC056232 TaxID=3345756 RepID=UPI0035E317AC
MHNKVKILIGLVLIFFVQLYCLIIISKGPIIGITITEQDQKWYIHNIEEEGWGVHQQLEPNTIILEIDGKEIPPHTSSPFTVTHAESLTIWHKGKVETLTVSYEDMTGQLLMHFVIPLIYSLLISALCIYLLQRPLTKNKKYLIFHLQFTALAYISAGAAGRGDFFSNIFNSLAIFISLVNCFFYCIHLLRIVSDSVQKKLRTIFFLIGGLLVTINVLRITIEDFITVQIIFEILVYSILSCLLMINIILAIKSNMKYYAKPLFFIFFLGIGPIVIFYGIPILFNYTPILPADVTALFLMIVPICLIYMELAESYVNLQYALDRMFEHLKLSIPFSLIVSFILILFQEARTIYLFSLYFLIIFIAMIFILSCKEWFEIKNARYMATLKDYNFSDFYHFIKKSTQYSNFENLVDCIKKELSRMLKLNHVEIVEDDIRGHLQYIDEENYSTICPNLIYKSKENYILVLHETPDSKLLAVVDTHFNKIPFESIKMLELFLYYVQSILDNSLKMDNLAAQLAKLDILHSQRWYSKLWISSTERERIRLSIEIHDTILQDLIRMSRNIEEAIVTVKDMQEKETFSHLRNEILDIMDTTRDICENLYPPLIERLGLYKSLNELIGKYKIRFNFIIRDYIEVIEDLSLQQATTIYRIIQELLSNANKHSQAHIVHINLTSKAQRLIIEYIDDGIGLDMNDQLNEIKSIGLMGIQARINYYQGTFEITPNHPSGVVIKISMKIGEDLENNGVG